MNKFYRCLCTLLGLLMFFRILLELMAKLKLISNACASMASTAVCSSAISVRRSTVCRSQALEDLQFLEWHRKDTQLISSCNNQKHVVEMKVALHCRGCAWKLQRHISKMEGVSAFTIDLEKKKVTVVGHLSPQQVLESVSTVKRAEFWHPSLTSSC